ncbi:ATP-grasp domain-containing protein [Streptoalloteichus hindustanus]|uniref:ATP-grasp domain-containing protein n=1 Tax=Streptoalloteichus hindustanus TaxID=2017 RepID=A0A1M4Y2Z6_STRHI|nr:hypothetical protein [Streptoalloteichus hindustanus]SHE99946.1 hypothetical protein SAMN05444320_102212 [Streptoalloteichus hindustanus]
MPVSEPDDAGLPAALAEVGVDAAFAPWDDEDAGFAEADLVVIRATWDYTLRRKEFLAWCDSVPRLANRADVVRWNTDKSYLVDLAADGVAVVPTELVPPGAVPDWPDVEVVVKPAVGAGSRGTRRFAPDQRALAESHLAELHTDRGLALVQPYQPAVAAEGETSLVYLGGVYSHSFHKGPMLGDATSGPYLAERLTATTPTAEQRELAENTLDAVAARFGLRRGDLVSARVDVLRGADGRQLLLELELIEPSLGFGQTGPEAPARYASAVRLALSAL